MNTIQVVLLGGWVCKDPHPKELPVQPKPAHFDERSKYFEALIKYHVLMKDYVEIDATLKKYSIETLKCESGMVVRAKVLNFRPYRGQTRSAVIVGENKVQIVPTVKVKH